MIQSRPDLIRDDLLLDPEAQDFLFAGGAHFLFAAVRTHKGNQRVTKRVTAVFTGTDLHVWSSVRRLQDTVKAGSCADTTFIIYERYKRIIRRFAKDVNTKHETYACFSMF